MAASERRLLACGFIGPLAFVAVFLVEGALRPDYDPRYLPVSALALGERGWIQVTNFVVCGVLLVAYSVGLRRALDSRAASVLLALVGLALVLSGAFSMDPMRGYPPGTPMGTPADLTWTHRVHDGVAPVIFVAIPIACIVVGLRLRGGWRIYSFVSAVGAVILLVAFVTAWQADLPDAGIRQRVMIIFDFGWIAAIAHHLRVRASANAPGRPLPD